MVERILQLIQERGITAYKLTSDLGISSGAVTDWKKGKAKPNTDAVIKIADYFDVSTDYLLKGKEFAINNAVHTNNGSIGVVGQTNAPLTIYNGSTERKLSDEEGEILRIFNSLDVKKRHKLLETAFSLDDERSAN